MCSPSDSHMTESSAFPANLFTEAAKKQRVNVLVRYVHFSILSHKSYVSEKNRLLKHPTKPHHQKKKKNKAKAKNSVIPPRLCKTLCFIKV